MHNKVYNSIIAFQLLSLVCLFIFTIFNKHVIFWDEAYYMLNVAFLKQYGISERFLTEMWGPAGPLYAIVHYCLSPLTGLKEPNARLVNVLFLLFIIFILFFIHKNKIRDKSAFNTLSIMSIPMIFVCAGMALTEIPAMLFVVASMGVIVFQQRTQNHFVKILLLFFAGLLMGLSILGRQPYIVLLLPIIFLIFDKKYTISKNISFIILFEIAALLLPLYVFWVWSSPQPLRGSDTQTSQGFVAWHGILALGYAAIITLFIAPSWFVLPSKKNLKYFAIAFIFVIILNVVFIQFSFTPSKTLLAKLFNENIIYYISLLFASLIIYCSLFFLYSSIVNLSKKYTDLFFVFCCVSVALILLTSTKVSHQFSTRYVAQAAPFIVLMLSNHIKYNYAYLFRVIIAASLGFSSLYSFFNQ